MQRLPHVKTAVVALSFAALSVTAANGASSATPKWYWSETYVEKRVVKTAVVPCNRVRLARDCLVADAIQELDRFNAAIASCDAKPPDRAITCLAFLTTLRNPQTNLDHVRDGFPVAVADCVGGGSPNKSGFRFAQFRCKITVRDFLVGNKPVDATGRIAVYVSGKTTFRWKLIV